MSWATKWATSQVCRNIQRTLLQRAVLLAKALLLIPRKNSLLLKSVVAVRSPNHKTLPIVARATLSLSAHRTETSDVCVIGGGVGGLICAIKLARAGKSVKLIEQNSKCGGRMNSEIIDLADSDTLLLQKERSFPPVDSPSFRFDVGPSLLLLPSVYEETFAELGEKLSDHVTLLPVQPLYRCFFEEKSNVSSVSFADISADQTQMENTLEAIQVGAFKQYRSYMKVASGFLGFGLPTVIKETVQLNKLAPFLSSCVSAFPLRTHHSVLRQFFGGNEKLCAMFSFQDLYVGLSPYETPAVFSLLQALEYEEGIFYPEGGFRKVAEALETIARKAGVDVVTNMQVLQLERGAEAVAKDVSASSTVDDSVGGTRVAIRAMPLQISSIFCGPTNTNTALTVATRRIIAEAFVVNTDAPHAERALVMPFLDSIDQQSRNKTKARSDIVTSDMHVGLKSESGKSTDRVRRWIDRRTAVARPSCGVLSLHFGFDTRLDMLTHHSIFFSAEYKRSWQAVEEGAGRSSGDPASEPNTWWWKFVDTVSWIASGDSSRMSEANMNTGSDSHSDNNKERRKSQGNSAAAFDESALNFYVHAPARTDPSCCRMGGDAITVLVPVPPLPATPLTSPLRGEEDSWDKDSEDALVQTVRAAVLRRLQAVPGMPVNLESHLKAERVRTPRQWQKEFNLYRGSAFGLAHSIDQLSLFRPRLRHPYISNLYRVGASTRPGNGVPLVMIGAGLTANTVLADILHPVSNHRETH